jgi:uncharacterized protein (DUF1697 family)
VATARPPTNRYVALLRGINVGGKNLIKMAALKASFEKHGLSDVATYIQSGNVLFTSGAGAADKLARGIEEMLVATFGCAASVVLRSGKQMRDIVGRAPAGFGAQPDRYRYDVIYLKPPLAASVAMKSVATAPGVDQAHAGAGVLYFSRLTSKASQSRLSRLVSMPVYQSMTIRNWNTTTTLLRMLDGAQAA